MSDTKPSTVAEIKAMPEDDTVFCFIGKIKKRYARIAKENDRGPYSFENLDLTDATGSEIKAKLKDCEPLPAEMTVGKSISILAHKGDKGWTGVKAKDDEYKGKVSRILWITPSAVISLQATPGQGRQEPSGEHSACGVRDAKQRQVQLVNLMRANLDAAAWLAEQFSVKHPKFTPMTTEDVRSIAATLQIGCEHAGCPPLMPTELVKATGKGAK